MSKKIIGIVASKFSDVFGASVNNLEFVRKFGEPRLILPHEEYVQVDALYLGGGMDMDTMDYKEVPTFATGNMDAHREFFYKHRMKVYIDNKVPIFGVCLGMQQLAVYFGSKMTQHSPFHAQSPARWAEAHKVYDQKEFANSKSEKELEEIAIPVNSHHHQYIGSEDIAKELIPIHIAVNEDFERTSNSVFIIESFKHESLPIVGVQWHPEEWYDDIAIELFNEILK